MTRHIEQVDSFIQEELNKIFIEELELPNALVTITKVKTNKDLSQAKIFLSVLPITQKSKVITIIKKQAGHLRYLLSKKFQAFHVPKLEFEIDDSMLKQRQVEREINKLYQEEN